jgi:hypothetical protein
MTYSILYITRENSGGHQEKEKKRGNTPNPRNMKTCHNVTTALLKSVAVIGTQSAMKSSTKTLH